MKIAMIHGQNHKGSTYHIGRMLADKMAGNEDITEFFLPRDLNHFCLGCYQCVEQEEKCPFYVEKHRIMNAIETADFLIFTTPVYCLRATAPMKSFIDLTFTYWMVHRPRACMFRKGAIVLSTAAGGGTKSAIKDIKTALFHWGIAQIKTYGINLHAMNWERVSAMKREKIEKKMTLLAKRFLVTKPPKVGIRTKFIFCMMAVLHKKGWDASPVERKYWDERGWLDKARPWKHK